jgi:hypothetical protein
LPLIGEQLLQRGDIILRLGQVAGLKILAQLLKPFLNLLELVLHRRGIQSGEKAAC